MRSKSQAAWEMAERFATLTEKRTTPTSANIMRARVKGDSSKRLEPNVSDQP